VTLIPATIRNNNPGALFPGPSAKRYGGAKEPEILRVGAKSYPIVRFPTAVHGAAALFHNLFNARDKRGYYYRGQTLGKAIETWCGELNAQSYLALIKSQTGMVPGHTLSEEFLRDPDRAIPLAKAMAWHEAGTNFPLDDMGWRTAHVMAFGEATAPEPTPTNDVPTMRPEARAAVKAAETAATVAKVGGAVVGGGSAVAVTTQTQAPNPTVPVPPAPDLSSLTEWQFAVQTGKGLATFAVSHLHWIAAAALLYWLICYVWPRRQA
jgi:hypothetical protein